jgi:hypothetical protein
VFDWLSAVTIPNTDAMTARMASTIHELRVMCSSSHAFAKRALGRLNESVRTEKNV